MVCWWRIGKGYRLRRLTCTSKSRNDHNRNSTTQTNPIALKIVIMNYAQPTQSRPAAALRLGIINGGEVAFSDQESQHTLLDDETSQASRHSRIVRSSSEVAKMRNVDSGIVLIRQSWTRD